MTFCNDSSRHALKYASLLCVKQKARLGLSIHTDNIRPAPPPHTHTHTHTNSHPDSHLQTRAVTRYSARVRMRTINEARLVSIRVR